MKILNLKVCIKNQKYLFHKIIELLKLLNNCISVNNESKQQKEQSDKVSFETKSQNKVECNSEDKGASTSFNDLEDNYSVNEFEASSKKQEKQENKEDQENSKYSIHEEEDVTKEKKKVEFNYKSLLLMNSFFSIKRKILITDKTYSMIFYGRREEFLIWKLCSIPSKFQKNKCQKLFPFINCICNQM